MDSLSPFLWGSFIPYNMPVYPGALRIADNPGVIALWLESEGPSDHIEGVQDHQPTAVVRNQVVLVVQTLNDCREPGFGCVTGQGTYRQFPIIMRSLEEESTCG